MTGSRSSTIELSVIVPVLNERDELPGFLANLALQKDVCFELLICDGGSNDGSLEWLQSADNSLLEIQVLTSLPGRGKQLNCGIGAARGEWLLLLHVDSRFEDPLAFRGSLDCLSQFPNETVAGHFALSFRREAKTSDFAYYYYEWKARLGFEETIHGDQGFFLHHDRLDDVERFDESLPVMEDTDLADRLRGVAQWQLLPYEISTSARRFEQEGLWQRQLLGALIMCFRKVGWCDFFDKAPSVYRQQGQTTRLQVSPFFALVRELIGQMSFSDRVRHWFACGSYVREHGWQIFFALDARRAWRAGEPVGKGNLCWYNRLNPLYVLLTDHFIGRMLATVLLKIWFVLTFLWLKKLKVSEDSCRLSETCATQFKKC